MDEGIETEVADVISLTISDLCLALLADEGLEVVVLSILDILDDLFSMLVLPNYLTELDSAHGTLVLKLSGLLLDTVVAKLMITSVNPGKCSSLWLLKTEDTDLFFLLVLTLSQQLDIGIGLRHSL